ncbi:piggyBac transposable element-derived protein 4-like [Eupeodes corollae]|uniref:piggyBac transposable element-derived protein 4-like n=1 Tax=Eupeodes corollae TaxID=290404 RepID=UPI0024914922|nr:piggyBac transposable element-derived protein 4-like [Eupeodes corollae]
MSNPGPSTSSRWDRKTKQKIEIDCPFIIKEYNRHMGGVDLMDGLLGRYHIRMKTRKWTNRIFFHLLDVAMVNAYILYHRSNKEVTIELPNFRSEVAETLCIISTDSKKPRGRPVSSPIPPPSKSKKSYFPTSEVRYDNVGHWCIFQDRNGKKTCKQPGCKSELNHDSFAKSIEVFRTKVDLNSD